MRVSLLSRVCATLFSWKSKSPPLSPGGSLHAQEQFKAAAPPASILGDAALKVAPAEVVVSSMKRSLSFLWDWSKYRGSPQSTPGNSLHGGNAFAAGKEEEEVNHGGSKTPAIQPPKAMTKNHSIGSFMWDWGAQRVSPPSTPGSSLHGGSQFTQKPANAA